MATAPRTPSGAKVVAKKFYTFKWEGVNRKGQKVSGEMQGRTPISSRLNCVSKASLSVRFAARQSRSSPSILAPSSQWISP